MWLEWSLYAAVGIVSGFFAGLLGIGGGIIAGPLLIIMFVSLLGFDPETATRLSIGTAMAVIACNSLVSGITHYRARNIEKTYAPRLAAGLVGGAIIGVAAAPLVPAAALKLALAAVLLSNAAFLLLPKKEQTAQQIAPPTNSAAIFAAAVGAISAAIGIGGGIITTPYLVRRGVHFARAVGTSAVIIVPLAFAAAAGYLLQTPAASPKNTVGAVYLPALFCITLFSILFAYIGAKLTKVLPVLILRRIFAALTAGVAIHLLIIAAAPK